MRCPDCEGSGLNNALIAIGITVPCGSCNGSGERENDENDD